MLKLLGNNFILSGVIALILVIVVFVERRNSDKKNNHKSIKDWVFWGKLFGVSYLLVLLVLLMKDKCPLSGGSCSGESGKSCMMSLSSLKNKFSRSSAPSKPAVTSGGVVATTNNVSSVPSNNLSGGSSGNSDLRVIDLNNVNIGDPDF